MRIFIDLTRIIPKKGNPYHGGGYYTYQIINGLLNNINGTKKINIMWPENYKPRIKADEDLLNNININNHFIDDMWTYDYSNADVLFMPIIDPWNFNKLNKIKNRYSKLRTIVTLHDLRIIDILKYDKYNSFYYKYGELEYFLHYLKRWFTFFKCRNGLRYASKCTDFLITDSNFSMQQILKYTGAIDINYYYLNVERFANSSCFKNDEFILFVSANREEKNFMRSLSAYLNAVKRGKINISLFVTGTSNDFINIMKRNKNIDLELLSKHVKLLGHVTEEEMQGLYQNCKFLLYTSKSEGFGLPVLNAGVYGRPVVASNRTSVPEVLGSTALYVDPYNTDSIEHGIEVMCRDYFYFEKKSREYIPVIDNMMRFGQNRTIELISRIN